MHEGQISATQMEECGRTKAGGGKMECRLGGDDFLLRRDVVLTVNDKLGNCSTSTGWLCLVTLLAIILFCSLDLSAQTQPKESAPAPHVSTVNAERKPIAKTHDFVGRVDAINRVEVRARVKGYLDAVLFKEGDLVHEGTTLYQIEKGLFEAAVEQAEGALERSKSTQVLTAAQLERAEELLPKGATTVVARDQALAADREAQGQIITHEADLKSAKINLGYTSITAPITGRIGKTNVTRGNVVGPDSGVLTVIVSQDPMHVTFPVSQREFLRFQEAGQGMDTSHLKIRLRFADGASYNHIGHINFVDVTVDHGTDTLLVRATFPNPSGGLIDGQLVRVDTESGTPEEKVLIPQAALISDQEGVYVFVVDQGKAAVRRVKRGGDIGANVVVEDGLSGGEQVIVEGLQGVRAGMPVTATPMPVTLGRT
jgi:membrane fusion protein (multidrug efflux system)